MPVVKMPLTKNCRPRRAESAVEYIVSKGISQDRVIAKGYGESRPRRLEDAKGEFQAGPKMTEQFISTLEGKEKIEEAHQLNRRTEFKVIE